MLVMLWHHELGNWEALFTIHSGNVQSLDKIVYIESVYRVPSAGVEGDTELLELMRTVPERAKEFSLLEDFNFLTISWEN